MVVYVSAVLFSREQELCGVWEEVGKWWSGYEGATQWLGETEGDLITHKPLASSLDIIQRQKDSVQVWKNNQHLFQCPIFNVNLNIIGVVSGGWCGEPS